MKKKLLAGFLTIFAFLCFSTLAMADFSTVVSFGDSLTDNGSITRGTNSIADDYHGFQAYTHGTPWADKLAALYGDDTTILNVAYGGATTGFGNIYSTPLESPNGVTLPSFYSGLQYQVNDTGIQTAFSAFDMDSTLFTVWAGANDYNRLNAMSARYGRTPVDAEYIDTANIAAANVITALDTLVTNGALHILVNDLGIMGDTVYANTYNAALAALLLDFQAANPDVTLYNLDTGAVIAALYQKQALGELTAEEEAQLLWIDDYHPGETTHTALAAAAYLATTAPAAVPVPGAMILFASGLTALVGISRRRKAA